MLFNIISISLGAILINNFIFSQFLGCCPFLGCSNKTDTAFGMGVAVIFVMGMASAICWLIDTYILVPLGLAFLETLAFILIIAALVPPPILDQQSWAQGQGVGRRDEPLPLPAWH